MNAYSKSAAKNIKRMVNTVKSVLKNKEEAIFKEMI